MLRGAFLHYSVYGSDESGFIGSSKNRLCGELKFLQRITQVFCWKYVLFLFIRSWAPINGTSSHTRWTNWMTAKMRTFPWWSTTDASSQLLLLNNELFSEERRVARVQERYQGEDQLSSIFKVTERPFPQILPLNKLKVETLPSVHWSGIEN